MHRREFLALPCAAAALKPAPPSLFPPQAENLFLRILRGFLVAAAQTSNSFAVVEYPQATVTKNFLAKSGLSATGVTRMLPAIAAWISGKRRPGVIEFGKQKFDLLDVAGSAIVNGTDPNHKDYWQAAPPDASDQRQVESSIVAWSLYLLRDTLLPQMSSAERRRIDEWLAGCTRREVRHNNWAWFTAVNHAARMALKDKFDEFTYDQASMFADLNSLDAMHAGDGWYNDDRPRYSFDYYNSWVFASHFLYWNAMVGARFPEWAQGFSSRLRRYLETAPLFFGANGAHVLYGRSLIYRWGVLTPLVLAYQQGHWPHGPAMLQRIVASNLEYHDHLGAYSVEHGKLLETFSSAGTRDIRETYIDGGHPYWGMQAFAMWLIPAGDPFWVGDAAPVPVEKSSFVRVLNAPGMLLAGNAASGQVKLLQARSTKSDLHYRDKYNKLVYSSHFPFCITHRADITPWDNALVLRDKRRRRSAGRGPIDESRLVADGMDIAYPIKYGALTVQVRTTVTIDGEFELRTHRVIAPPDVDPSMELAEGSAALGLDSENDAQVNGNDLSSVLLNKKSGALVATWAGAGWSGLGAAYDFGAEDTAASNIVHRRVLVNTLWTPLKPGAQVLHSVHYASPKPLARAALAAKGQALLARLTRSSIGAEKQTAPAKPRP